MNLDLAITNGILIDEHGERAVELGVRAGQIVVVATRGQLPSAAQTIDAQGLWVLPGFVDAHFHCRAPDHPAREDFASGTMAAAAGGVTTLCEMPISNVGVTNADILNTRRALLERDAYIDVGLFAACGTLDRDAIHGLADAGAIAFKVFTHRAPKGRESAFQGMCLTENHEFWRALTLTHETGLPCAFHAEDDALIDVYGKEAHAKGLKGVEFYLASRPSAVEAMAVARLVTMAEATGAHVHIVHVTSAWAADIVRQARRRGARVTAETCPQYMLFDEEIARKFGTWVKVAPPLRSKADCEALWAALADGTLDFVASDHAPFTAADREGVSLEAAPSGMPNVEVFAPLVLSAARERCIPMQRAIGWLTANPARVYGFYPRKGALMPGTDADIVLYDPNATTTIDTRRWFSRSRDAARVFDGVTYRGRVVQTIARGQTVFREGAIVGERGWGRMVKPVPSSSSEF